MLEIRDISLQRGDKVLLNRASLNVPVRGKIGLIGKNGCGKSSLFAMIRGELFPDSGDIRMPCGWKIASVKQETPSSELSALDYVLSADKTLQTLKQRLIDAEKSNDGIAISQAHVALEEINAYSIPAFAAKLLSGLGFAADEHQMPVKTFSGGWRMRLNLAQALIQKSDLLLLDEPTNHLDLETVLWLENYLNNIDSALLVISHDRSFLNATTFQTVELSNQKLTIYGGNYDFYCQQKAERIKQHKAAYEKQQAHIKHLQSFIDRFRAKATKATQAQSRIKSLEKLQKIAPAYVESDFSFDFLPSVSMPHNLVRIENADIGYQPEQPVLNQVSLILDSNCRYGLLGVNGSGKTTLVKTIVGQLPIFSGSLNHSDKLKIGYFAQHQLDALNGDKTPLQHIRDIDNTATEQEIRNFLGQFGFHGNEALSIVAPMSGGEKARLALAILVWQRPNLLLLDEPTNHLDLNMRHALTVALQNFQGALLIVSHDRELLENVCDSFVVIQKGSLKIFDGSLDEYQKSRLEENKNTSNRPTFLNRKQDKRIEAQMRQELSRKTKPYQKIIDENERLIESLQQEKNEAECFLSSEQAYNDENKEILQKTINRLRDVENTLKDAENKWLEAMDKVEAFRQEFLQQLSE